MFKNKHPYSAYLIIVVYSFVAISLSIIHHHEASHCNDELEWTSDNDSTCQICYTFSTQLAAQPAKVDQHFSVENRLEQSYIHSIDRVTPDFFSKRAPPIPA
ncbi:hypothetical protein EP331_02345 [bacterium]|nr:MAG: hypothetical protein EP331_02345 [bacterium]